MSHKSGGKQLVSIGNETSNHTSASEPSQDRPSVKVTRSSKKGIAFGKRSNSMKRNPNAPAVKSGWLYKQASSGVKQWNKRWFVLVDHCLYYYKDEKEECIQGSIPLLSFAITPVRPADSVSRKHAFKVTVYSKVEMPGCNGHAISSQVEHAGIRTYFFSAENKEDEDSWIQVMSEASHLQTESTQRREKANSENIPPVENHHVYHQKELMRSDLESKARGEGDGRGCDKTDRKEHHPDNKKGLLTKVNGSNTPEVTSEPGSPYPDGRLPSGVERPGLPNGWQYPSPNRPSNTVYPQQEGGENAVLRRGFVPRTDPEKAAQRQSSMTQLQQWVNQRRGMHPSEELRSPTRYYMVHRGLSDYYGPYATHYPEDYQYYPPGVRPDSICSVPAYDRVPPHWAVDEKRHSLRDGAGYHFRDWKDPQGYSRQEPRIWHPGVDGQQVYYDEVDAPPGNLRHLSMQPRSRSVPRSPSHGTYARARMYSPVRSPSARFERMPPQREDIYADPIAYGMRRSISSPKYEFSGDRRSVPSAVYPFNFAVPPTIHDKMDELLDLQLQRNLEFLDQQMNESDNFINTVHRMVETSSPRAHLYIQAPPFPDGFRDTLQALKLQEQEIDKLLSKLCEHHKILKEQEKETQQLQIEKETLESALMSTHHDLELFGNQPVFPEKLLHKKESLQNQLINIRGELSQASTALAATRMEFETLESEVSVLHNELWDQLNRGTQSETVQRHIQKELWRIQDVMEGLMKSNPSRGTDTAKHRVASGLSGTVSTNSPASPLSSASITSPMSPFSLVSGSQGSPARQTNEEMGPPRPPLPKSYVPLEPLPSILSFPSESRIWSFPNTPSWPQSDERRKGQQKFSYEQHKKETLLSTTVPDSGDVNLLQGKHESDVDKQAGINKVGVVPPLTKSPAEENSSASSSKVRKNSNSDSNEQISRERPKSAVFANDMKSKMSVEEQLSRMKLHQSGSVKEKRRSLQLSANQQLDSASPKPTYRVVRRHRSIHEVDISDLEAAVRKENSSKNYESPREEIARLRKTDLEPEHYNVDISKEISTPDKVLIPERYIELEPDTPLSPEEIEEKQKKVERIKTLIAKSSMQNVIVPTEGVEDIPVDTEAQLQEQEKRIEISCALAAEASRRSRLLSAQALAAVKFHGATF
ncbi:pleckstrin homology domain-containing family A member 6 isoform X4 [Protopterus annectens]|uniref:pleckstrin homology domain-containing family A member 6 isoform X4 n=1 Tax=Protopterus annectens TaxID=7888 RepID=UPI001CFBB090|nr:pleckstrin homology domain-containing family A member 6 isoform X4 [Protopterus annectens]